MKRTLILALALSAFASHASGATTTTTDSNPMVKDSTVRPTTAPASGVSSFTESQARGRLTKAGYSAVSKLSKDKTGAWMGMATKGGKKVHVMLDYKGNVTAH